MSMSIRTNVASLNAQHALFNANNDLQTSMQRLSSGYRINSSADDAAGLAISTKLQSQIGGLNQAAMNAQDGISMIQTAEGALDEVTSSLQRMRDLAVQASNSTLSDTDRGNINQEIQALYSNINNITGRTQFNGQNLLTGALTTSADTTSGVLGGMALATDSTASVSTVDVSKAAAGAQFDITADTVGNVTLTNHADTTQTQTIHANDLTAGQSQTFDFSTFGVSFTVAASGAATGADTATDLATGGNIITAAGSGSAAFQVGANANQTESATFFNAQINASNSSANGVYSTLQTAITTFGGAQGHTIANAQSLITGVDNVIAAMVSSRAALGASQNSLTHTMNNLQTTSNNLSASNSRIRDVDVASESAAMTRAQIISQSAVSVLAQANQMPQLALKLLG
jgi:flagellin